jgi:hypothetical protein
MSAKSNGTFDLMKAMQDMESRLSTQIGAVGSSVSTALAQVQGVQQTHATFREELLGEKGRITVIEDEMTRQDWKRWLHSLVIVPILALLHAIAHQFGWQW